MSYRGNPGISLGLSQDGPVAGSGFSSVGHLHVVVVDDEVGVEPDPVDAAAAGPDGDVVAEARAAAVGAGVAPLVQPG